VRGKASQLLRPAFVSHYPFKVWYDAVVVVNSRQSDKRDPHDFRNCSGLHDGTLGFRLLMAGKAVSKFCAAAHNVTPKDIAALMRDAPNDIVDQLLGWLKLRVVLR
jgi:hypothetical protein